MISRSLCEPLHTHCSIHSGQCQVYTFTGYIPNTDVMSTICEQRAISSLSAHLTRSIDGNDGAPSCNGMTGNIRTWQRGRLGQRRAIPGFVGSGYGDRLARERFPGEGMVRSLVGYLVVHLLPFCKNSVGRAHPDNHG